MKQRLKVLIPAIIIMLIFAVGAVVACVLIFNKADSDDFKHLEVSGGNSGSTEDFKVSLYRVNLDTKIMDEEEGLVANNNSTVTDFTSANKENIFGLSGDSVIVPGSMYSADMVIENASSSGSVAYWLNIVVTEGRALGEQLKFTVSVDGEEIKNGNLSETVAIGDEHNVLALVSAGKTSKFNVKVEFVGSEINNDVQGDLLYFDLAVKAVFVG